MFGVLPLLCHPMVIASLWFFVARFANIFGFIFSLKIQMFLLFSPSFLTMVELQFNTKLKSIQTDWSGEFHKLTPFFSKMGSHQRVSCTHTHEQNGLVEWRHRHIVEMGLTLLAQYSSSPKKFCHLAFEIAIFLINRMLSPISHGIFPFLCLFKKPPDYLLLKVFGCFLFSISSYL